MFDYHISINQKQLKASRPLFESYMISGDVNAENHSLPWHRPSANDLEGFGVTANLSVNVHFLRVRTYMNYLDHLAGSVHCKREQDHREEGDGDILRCTRFEANPCRWRIS